MATAAAEAGYIRPEIAQHAVPIDQVQPYPGNARQGDQEKLRASLRAHGQYKTLLVQASTGYVVAGNNTLAAMRDLGFTHVAVQKLDIDDDRARAMLLIDNRTSDEADYDRAALAELLAGVQDFDATGWDPDDLDDLLAGLDTITEPGAADTLPPAVAAFAPTVLPAPPATDATYAETPEQEAARAARLASQVPRAVKGMGEVILVYEEDDRQEAVRLIQAGRDWLGRDLKSSEVVLRALRALAAIGDMRHSPHTSLDVGALLKAAGYEPEPE